MIALMLLLAASDVAAWRQEQDAKMRGERSPFAVERVVALEKERTTAAELSLPGGFTAVLRAGQVFLEAHESAVRVNGGPAPARALETTDWIAAGHYRLQLRRPEGKPALRISNLRSPAMRAYRGLRYFPEDSRFRVAASFTPAAGRRTITVEATKGGPQTLPYAGKLSFELLGRKLELDAFIDADEPDKLFIIFRDQTSGQETYPVGRYLYAAKESGGRVLLDFNLAWNPYCAYGPLFFCPIPPKQNHLPVAITAGEKTYHRRDRGEAGLGSRARPGR
jgi:uncharacterized protein (DUF1684 family)